MNKVLIISFVMLGVFCGNAQENEEDVTRVEVVNQYEEVEVLEKNEIRLNAAYLLAGPLLDVSYERLLSPSNSFGVTTIINLGKNDIDYADSFSISPYYRFYFLSRKDFGSRGFFVDVQSTFHIGENFNSQFIDGKQMDRKYTDLSIDVGIGRKWINRAGFTFETSLTLGRPLFSEHMPDPYFRFSVSIGKRF